MSDSMPLTLEPMGDVVREPLLPVLRTRRGVIPHRVVPTAGVMMISRRRVMRDGGKGRANHEGGG